MSDKKFEVTYSDEAKKVIGPFGKCYQFSGVSPFGLIEDDGLCAAVSRTTVGIADKLDDEVCKYIIDVAKEQGCSSIYILDKEAIAEKLMRLEPKEIEVHGYVPGRAVNSLSYTCPTCVAPSGNIGNGDYGNGNGVRPFCILKSSIFVSE